MKKVDGCIALSFKKIRIRQKHKTENIDLHDKRRSLKTKTDAESKTEQVKVTQELADRAEVNYKNIVEELKELNPEDKGIDAKELRIKKNKNVPQNSAMILT